MFDITRQWQKLRASNSTDSSFASRVATATEPTTATAGVIDANTNGQPPSILQLMFFGAGSDNDTFDARVIGWNFISDGGSGSTGLWMPTVLAQVSCTISAAVGVSGKIVADTDRFADTITLATGFNSSAVEVVSPTGDVPGHVQMDLKGFARFEVTFDRTGASSCNALYRLL